MARKLPIRRTTPSVDTVRKRLGGRASTEPGAGEIVTVNSERGLEQLGVILFANGDEVDVWTEGPIAGIVRRTRRARLAPPPATVPATLALVARDARVFARLSEGCRVRYATDRAEVGEATLVEKCRYGALLLRDDGRVVGVGFRRVWPLSAPN